MILTSRVLILVGSLTILKFYCAILDLYTSSIASFTLLVLATNRLHDSAFEHKKRLAQNNKILDLTPKEVNKISMRNGKYN